MKIVTLESSKYIIIVNKYKQHVPSESSKKTKQRLPKVVTILNTKKSSDQNITKKEKK